jgi:hypothetical protein
MVSMYCLWNKEIKKSVPRAPVVSSSNYPAIVVSCAIEMVRSGMILDLLFVSTWHAIYSSGNRITKAVTRNNLISKRTISIAQDTTIAG